MSVGALLEDDREDREQELALRYAIDRINNNNAILPASRLRLLTQRLPPGDAFHAFKTGAWHFPSTLGATCLTPAGAYSIQLRTIRARSTDSETKDSAAVIGGPQAVGQ
ncbi:hypothetical protein HPB50_013035 [Hyalomma asiaticum]|uniref:Uncharacterized protein n=1 Tax=Hyalomma asiaticum TaxID=266040 RepID=A0ACB7S2D2_HYAAI|nr:hypothetical protein HPB50_013035 [Hyalomma asiaticum]